MIWRILRILFFILVMFPVVIESAIALIFCGILWIMTGKDYLEGWALNDPLLTFMIGTDKWLIKKSAGNAKSESPTTFR